MDKKVQILIFQLNDQKYAIALSSVFRVLRAATVTPLPKAPLIIHGILDLGGEIIPVINMRRRLSFPELPIRPDDRFILSRTSRRNIILAVDAVLGMEIANESDFTEAESVLKGIEIEGILKRDDGLILIYDIDKFLPLEDDLLLSEVLLKLKHSE